MQNHVSPEKIIAAGGLGLFNHQDALEVAQILLDNATDSNFDIESLISKLDPGKVPLLIDLSRFDQGQFGENVDAIFSDCLKALQYEQSKRQRGVSLDKIRHYEQGREIENLNDSLKEFTNLK